MSSIAFPPPTNVWKQSPKTWIAFAVLAALLCAFFAVAIQDLWRVWMNRPEYSFGIFIPVLSAFLIWQRKDRLERNTDTGSWSGLALIALAVLLRFVGDLATSTILLEYALVLAIMGIALAYLGWSGFKIVLMPLVFLFFMIPLPEFLLQALSQRLQLISSEIGVGMIRLCNISVYLEGNMIDLGTMKLQVAEACSGLRYLFSLMTLSFISAYFFKGELWKKILIFVSSLPITVLMNSFRIGLVGITVEYFGKQAAEGLLHDFEGLVIFMGCTIFLIAEMWLLARVGRIKLPLQTAFGLDLPAPTPAGTPVRYRALPKPVYVAGILLAAVSLIAFATPQRTLERPLRTEFSQFPTELDGWRGRLDKLEQMYIDILKTDDTLLADYVNAQREAVNLYVQYYSAQTRDSATHSPRLCIPAGGWEIARLDARELDGVRYHDQPLKVNRVVITRGEATLLVYYWFQQRGRNTTNEYMTKWLIFWDSLTKNRADGSMIRIITQPRPGEPLEMADARLTNFAAALMPVMPKYIPE